jgi:simple sugar transport system ATP-binding protein
MVLQTYFKPSFTSKIGFLRKKNIQEYANRLIEEYDVRSGQGAITPARAMSGGNQQKAIIARMVNVKPAVLIAFQPTRGVDVGAIEFIHKTLIAERDRGCAILLISFELDEVMNVSDTIKVIYHGQIKGSFEQGTVDEKQLGLLMAGGELK